MWVPHCGSGKHALCFIACASLNLFRFVQALAAAALSVLQQVALAPLCPLPASGLKILHENISLRDHQLRTNDVLLLLIAITCRLRCVPLPHSATMIPRPVATLSFGI